MMKRAAQILRLFATTYLVVILLAAGWAFYTDLTLLHSQREHLAPDILLLIVTLPLSSSLTFLYIFTPSVETSCEVTYRFSVTDTTHFSKSTLFSSVHNGCTDTERKD
jgi:hypothetical protein